MGVVELSLYIDGQQVTEPKQWQDLKVSAAFGVNSNQPEIEVDRMELVKDAATKVMNHVSGGGIFDGMNALLQYRERNNTIGIFEGFIDTGDNYEEINPSFGAIDAPNTVNVKFRGANSVTNFFNQIEGVTYGYMYTSGAITDSDFIIVKTAIVKKSTFIEVAMAIVTIYILVKQIKESIKALIDTIANITGHASGGVTGPAAAAIYAIAVAIIQIAYIIAQIAIVIKLVVDLMELLLPPVIENKGCTYRTLLSKVCDNYGFTFVSPIPELDTFTYLPTKPYTNSTDIVSDFIPKNVPTSKGIPSPGDFGYLITEMFELCKRMFHAKIDVIDNEVHLRTEDDPYWLKTATFKPRIDFNFPSKQYNTDDLNQTQLYSYVTDSNDEWTVEDYTGTSYEIKTELTNPTTAKNSVISGLDRVDFPIALPSVKTTLNEVEKLVLELAKTGDAFSKAVGGKSKLAAKVRQDRINVLRVSQNDYSIAKVVPLEGGNITPELRLSCHAKTLATNYHYSKSFVTGAKLGQKVIYPNIEMPFTLADYIKTLKNGTFVMNDGRKARFRNIPTWTFSSDMVTATIEVQQVYTNALKEVYYEP